ncbi:MAG: hypothetical protein KGH98_01365 [Candidatus Micrarchaeota archaeon]|nr:hypothetical protein [Candidatus Micrarchaeota archaeon]
MTKKLKLNPEVCYMLGLCSQFRRERSSIMTLSVLDSVTERFASIAMKEFGIEPNAIMVDKGEKDTRIRFYHSQIGRLFDQALERREHVFKYRNAYSGSYIAGMFDAVGREDGEALYFYGMKKEDAMVLERLGFHTVNKGRKTYIANAAELAAFIKGFSLRLSEHRKRRE